MKKSLQPLVCLVILLVTIVNTTPVLGQKIRTTSEIKAANIQLISEQFDKDAAMAAELSDFAEYGKREVKEAKKYIVPIWMVGTGAALYTLYHIVKMRTTKEAMLTVLGVVNDGAALMAFNNAQGVNHSYDYIKHGVDVVVSKEGNNTMFWYRVRLFPESPQNPVLAIESKYWIKNFKPGKSITLDQLVNQAKTNFGTIIDGKFLADKGMEAQKFFQQILPKGTRARFWQQISFYRQIQDLRPASQRLQYLDRWLPELVTMWRNAPKRATGITLVALGITTLIYMDLVHEFDQFDDIENLLAELQRECGTQQVNRGCAARIMGQSEYATFESTQMIADLIRQFHSNE